MRYNHKNAGEAFQVLLEPHTGFKVKMVGRLIQQKQRRVNEKSFGKRNTHSPTTRKVSCLLCLHLSVESKTPKNRNGLLLCYLVVQLIQALVDIVKSFTFCTVWNLKKSLCFLFKSCSLYFYVLHYNIKRSVVRWGNLSGKLVTINVIRKWGFTFPQRGKKHSFTTTVRPKKSISTAVIQLEICIHDHFSPPERKRKLFYFNISA
mmetsp:Transcript_21072/g.54771  ORF Transcript_21072/g.54771 Transcript_21072/m.54771 type:complete len:205 (+) Transcript_21072:1499-2113(+)